MKTMKNYVRRGFALLVALVMCLSLLPATAMAEEMEGTIPESTNETIDAADEKKADGTEPEVKSEDTSEEAEEESEEDSEDASENGSEEDSEDASEEESEEETEEVSEENSISLASVEDTESEESEGEDLVCTCETKCTTEASNAECPVCSAAGDDPSVCMGEEVKTVEPIAFDEETGTLTITGVKDDLTADVVKGYLSEKGAAQTDLKNLVFNDIGDIKAYAFSQWKLETVAINGAGSIGDHAFFKCANLKTVELTKVETVGSNAFSESDALTTVSLDSVEFVGAEAFRHCDTLANLTMKAIGTFDRSPFSYCIGLTSLTLDGESDSIKNLGTTMFFSCTGLESVTVKNVDTIAINVFYGCTGLKSITLDNIGSMGTGLLAGCTSPITLTVSNSDIGTSAFSGCTGLASVKMTNIGTIGEQAFASCTKLETVTMEGKVDTIGKNAFYNCPGLTSIELNNVSTIDQYAFNSCKGLTTATIENVDTIGQYAFYNCTGLETVTMDNVNVIYNGAFWNCSNLTSINSLSNVKDSIGGFAFYGCSKLTGLTIADATKMGYVGNYAEIMGRVEKILAGQFKLDDATEIEALTRDTGWTVGAIGQSDNWNTYDNGTQLMEQARWQGSTTAEVKVDAYYTGKQQMDYIFVADLSASMAQLGNPEDDNARFYDMQSKLLDMTDKLLSTDGYDCRVAIVTFGGLFNGNATHNNSGFLTKPGAAENYIKGLEPLNENTDYGLGLQEALRLVQGNNGRNMVVVFLSDGAPTAGSSDDQDGTIAAGSIKSLNVPIYGVLHSPTDHDRALTNMQAVCSDSTEDEKTVFESTDTASFGAAMNAAFAAAYGSNTVTIPVNAEDFDVSGLDASAGVAEYSDGIITWTLEGMPFTQHTLTYDLTLKPELANRYGDYTYNINDGDAIFGEGESAASVGLELTLSRTLNRPTASYTVRHEYYTNGVLDGANEVTSSAAVGSVISYADVAQNPEYEGNSYSYTSASDDVTVTAGGSAVITLRYDRTVAEPVTPVTPVVPTVPGGTTTITPTPTPAAPTPGTTFDEEVPLAGAAGLIDTDHFAYITGYDDGTVRPTANITRAEIATIFFRLMTEEYRVANWATENSFTDAVSGSWYNTAISVAAKAGILKGYTDGTVRPNANITRAEFASIAARFLSDEASSDTVGDFADTANHWAAADIRRAVAAGWIQGSGNKFRPDDYITRAEVMIVVNRMLDRVPNVETMLEGMKTWSDNPAGTWYYADVQEATTDHHHERGEDGVSEIWTELTEAKDWKALEEAWKANNGASAPKADETVTDGEAE